MRTIGLEQSPAYFSRRAHLASRMPSRASSYRRSQSLSQQRSIISVDSQESRRRSRERSTSPVGDNTGRSILEGEILDLHLIIEVDPDLHLLLEDGIQTPFGKDR